MMPTILFLVFIGVIASDAAFNETFDEEAFSMDKWKYIHMWSEGIVGWLNKINTNNDAAVSEIELKKVVDDHTNRLPNGQLTSAVPPLQGVPYSTMLTMFNIKPPIVWHKSFLMRGLFKVFDTNNNYIFDKCDAKELMKKTDLDNNGNVASGEFHYYFYKKMISLREILMSKCSRYC